VVAFQTIRYSVKNRWKDFGSGTVAEHQVQCPNCGFYTTSAEGAGLGCLGAAFFLGFGGFVLVMMYIMAKTMSGFNTPSNAEALGQSMCFAVPFLAIGLLLLRWSSKQTEYHCQNCDYRWHP